MCGIVGAYGPAGLRHEWIGDACEVLHHRGPDGSGVWNSPAAGVALGHRRLAILDLSDAGRQPMVSADGRYHIVFNGEIYNHLELRAALQRDGWHGHSDTETVLACLSRWGVERTLRALVGMFAFAVFDAREGQLVLARDRLGEKPLFYGYAGPAIVFASELKAARVAPGFDSTIDRTALALYMRHAYVPAPRTIYSTMRKLPPGTWLTLTQATLAERELPSPRPYWSALEAARAGEQAPLRASDAEAARMLETVLTDAVRGQMLSDVPLGAFLSGGIDSATVVALMQSQSTQRVRTFSIGFEEPEYDESARARAVASHLGTDHTELMVRADDALALVPRISRIYDEPFADSSQLPTLLVAQLARTKVSVALSGDGGDELFGGYDRYGHAERAWSVLSRVPGALRASAAHAVRALSPAAWNRLAVLAGPITPQRYRASMPGDRILKGVDLLACREFSDLYARLLSQWWRDTTVLGVPVVPPLFDGGIPELGSRRAGMMAADAMSYLPDDILVKVDRAAMSVSLETRVPLLDHRVFELAWRLPMHMKVRQRQSKWLLRQVLYRHVPSELMAGPKKGFAVPLASWLRGPLRAWAEALLAPSRLEREGYLHAPLIAQRWREHLDGVRNWHYQMWNVLMFQAWLDEQRSA